MKLEFSRLTNFRQFYGQQDVSFSSYEDLNVTVFHGDNGAGKTSLFSAINWCLYGEGVDDIGELISKRAVAEALPDEEITTSIQISFHHKGKAYVADRYITVCKLEKGYKQKTEGFNLSQIKKNGDHVVEDNPIGTMNAILPSNVRPYFFFDGEKMDDLTRANSEEVKEAIRNIMRLPALERAQDHLNSIAAEFRREVAKQGSPEMEKLTEEEEKHRTNKEAYLKRKDELEEEILLGKQKLIEVEDKLRDTKVTRDLQKDRDQINQQIEFTERQEADLVSDIQQVSNRLYLKYLPNVAAKAIAILDEKRQKGELPSGVRDQFVKDLLESFNCICGRPFEKGDDAFKNIESLLKKASSSRLEREASLLGGSLPTLARWFASDYDSLIAYAKRKAQAQELNEKLYAQLDDIRRKLESSPEKESANLEKLRTKLEQQYKLNISDQGKVIGALEVIEERIKEIGTKREKAFAKEEKAAFLSKKERLAQHAADAVAAIKDDFFENTRIEIEKATKDVFSKLAWKQDHFQDLILDENFRLEVIDRWGTPTRQELSAGERQILSLSFITALSSLSGEEAPLVMDTPFGRLSGNHLSAVAENLPDLTPQLILFVTDREWDEASRTKLEPHVGVQYKLNFERNTGCTIFQEVEY